MDEQVVADLRDWASGSYAAEAAVEMLARAFGGRFTDPGWAWIVPPGEDRAGSMCTVGHRLDADALLDATYSTALSGGERTYLRLVVGLFGPIPVDLSDVAGLDRDLQALVLAGLSHAGGSHQHSRIVTVQHRAAATGMSSALSVPVPGQSAGALYPWPGDEAPVEDLAADEAHGPAAAHHGEPGRTGPVKGVEQQKRTVPHATRGTPVDR